jgi:hypothetical protein
MLFLELGIRAIPASQSRSSECIQLNTSSRLGRLGQLSWPLDLVLLSMGVLHIRWHPQHGKPLYLRKELHTDSFRAICNSTVLSVVEYHGLIARYLTWRYDWTWSCS